MARPTKAENEKRTERYNLRLTLAEREWLASQARAAGLSEIDYVRRRILGQTATSRQTVTDPALIAELNAIGHNVNQLARATHIRVGSSSNIGAKSVTSSAGCSPARWKASVAHDRRHQSQRVGRTFLQGAARLLRP